MSNKATYWEVMFYMVVNHERMGLIDMVELQSDDDADNVDIICVQKMLVQLTLAQLDVEGGIHMDTEGERPVEIGEHKSLPWSLVSECLREWAVKPDAVLSLYRQLETKRSAPFN